MNTDYLEVRPGEAVTAEKWNKMQRAVRQSQLLPGGDNTRIQVTPRGTLINTKYGGGWNHPWRVVASQLEARVYPGMINGQFASMLDNTTGAVVLLTTTPAPTLSMLTPKLGLNGVGWIALELKVKEDYRTIVTAMVVQCDFIVGSETATTNPFFFYGLPGIGNFKVRYPLARLQYFPQTRSLTIYQVAMFNLNFLARPPNQVIRAGEIAQSSLPRYFFYPA